MSLCIALAAANTCHAQTDAENMVISELHDEGFEDIRLTITGDTLYAQLEDRAHRGTFRGAATAIRLTAQRHEELRHFLLVLTDYKMPQLIVRASKREGIWDVSVDRDMHDVVRRLSTHTARYPSTGRLDITVYPMISLVNNKLDHLFDVALRIAPAFAMTLWRGSRLTVQPIFPIVHKLDKDDRKRFIQLGCVNLSQQIVSTKHWDVSAAVGMFHPETYGLQAKAAYHVTRTLDLYVDGGITGADFYSRGEGFGFTNLDRINVMAGLNWYEPRTRLQFEVAAGQFLFGDRGGRADITRHFGEYAIGIYGIYTSHETNAGFHFAIPMGGKRQKRNGAVRLRLPEYFDLEYSMVSWFKYYYKRMGQSYRTQPDQNHAARFWQPAYIEEYVRRTLNEGFDLRATDKPTLQDKSKH